jgi:hypothetical protein
MTPAAGQPSLPGGAVPSAGPSEFTRILGRVAPPAGHPSPAPPGSALPGFMPAFTPPAMPGMPPAPAAPQFPGGIAPPAGLQAAQGLKPPQVPGAPNAGDAVGAAKSYVPLIIALNVVLIAAVSIIVYLVMRH